MWRGYSFVSLTPGMGVLVALLVLWSVIWKGVALWRAARNHQTAWYVVMLIINTAGILEIIYMLGFSHKKHHQE